MNDLSDCFNTLSNLYIKEVSFSNKMDKDISSYSFDTSITLNEFYKIDDQKLLFVSTIT